MWLVASSQHDATTPMAMRMVPGIQLPDFAGRFACDFFGDSTLVGAIVSPDDSLIPWDKVARFISQRSLPHSSKSNVGTAASAGQSGEAPTLRSSVQPIHWTLGKQPLLSQPLITANVRNHNDAGHPRL